jgi:hypothetical protein
MLALLVIVYLACIPIGWRAYRAHLRADLAATPAADQATSEPRP